MGQNVTQGAMMMCSFGVAPSVFTPIPAGGIVQAGGTIAGTVMDHIPMANIPPFAMCTSPSNPTVIAALGSPMPCVPVTPAPWVPGAVAVKINNLAALTSDCKCNCAWGGIISISFPGQVFVEST
jgi:hypothetical protein